MLLVLQKHEKIIIFKINHQNLNIWVIRIIKVVYYNFNLSIHEFKIYSI